jgi:HEAT repeat protein
MRGAIAGIGLGLVVVLAGCGRSDGPLLVHGRPVEHWLRAARDRDARVRQRAVEALGNVGTADPAAVPALTEAMRDRDPRVRSAAALCLLRIGPGARDAVPALEEAARKDRDGRVRASAARALEKIQAGS